MRMTYPIQPGQHQIGESPLNTLFLRTFTNRTDVITVRSPFSSSITTPWGKPSNLWTTWVYSFRPRVLSGLWIRWIQSASHRNNFMSPPKLAMSTATQNSAQTSGHFIPGQHFLETFTLLPPNNQDHTLMDDDNVPILNQQTYSNIFHSHIQQCLNVATHISLRQIAAKIPSQLHNYFLPFFLPTRLAA